MLTIRAATAFVGLPILLCLILFAMFRTNLAIGEHSDPGVWVLMLVFAGLAMALGRPAAQGLLARLEAPAVRRSAPSLALLVFVAFGAYLAAARLVLDAFPNSGDEIAYVLQAQTYGRGQIWADMPTPPAAFQLERFLYIRGHWVSQYPPGWGIALAPFAALGLPLWIVNPAIGALTLVMFYVLARRHVRAGTAWIGVLLLGLSAFYVLNVASYYNHPLATLCALAFALFAERFLDRGRWRDALLAGICLGLVGVIRTQNALPFLLAFGLMIAPRRDRWQGLVWLGLGGAPLLAALLAYHAAMTGSALLPPQDFAGSEPVGEVGLRSLRLTVNRVMRLHQWTSPILLYGAVAAFVALARRRRLGLTDWIAPITFVMFLAYGGDGGDQYGPRYYFEAWPFAILSVLKLAQPWLDDETSPLRDWTAAALISALVFQLAYMPPRLEREHQVIVGRQAMYAAVEAAGLKHAIVLVEAHVGTIRRLSPADLVRNGLDVGSQDVLYAHCVPGHQAELRRAYPDRTIYTYRDGRLRREQGMPETCEGQLWRRP